MFSCTVHESNEVDISTFKSHIIAKKCCYNDKHFVFIKVNGRKQKIQKDSFHIQMICVNQETFDKYQIGDTIK